MFRLAIYGHRFDAEGGGDLQQFAGCGKFGMAIDGVVIVDAKDFNASLLGQPGGFSRRVKAGKTVIGVNVGVGAGGLHLWCLVSNFSQGG